MAFSFLLSIIRSCFVKRGIKIALALMRELFVELKKKK